MRNSSDAAHGDAASQEDLQCRPSRSLQDPDSVQDFRPIQLFCFLAGTVQSGARAGVAFLPVPASEDYADSYATRNISQDAPICR